MISEKSAAPAFAEIIQKKISLETIGSLPGLFLDELISQSGGQVVLETLLVI